MWIKKIMLIMPILLIGLKSYGTESKVFYLDKGSVYQQLELKPGDVIKSINGKRLSSPKEVMSAYTAFNTPGKYVVKIVRDGKEEILNFEVQ